MNVTTAGKNDGETGMYDSLSAMWILRIIRSLSILSNYFLELNSKGG